MTQIPEISSCAIQRILNSFHESFASTDNAVHVHVGNSHTVLKNEEFSLTRKLFCQINSLVTYLVKPLLSRNFCQKCIILRFKVSYTKCENLRIFLPFKILREINLSNFAIWICVWSRLISSCDHPKGWFQIDWPTISTFLAFYIAFNPNQFFCKIAYFW